MNDQAIYIRNKELEAVNYIEKEVVPVATSDFKAEGLWQEAIYHLLKQQALIFVGKALEHLKEKGLEWAVDLANWLVEKLQDYLLAQYQKALPKEKELFKKKMLEKFPNSELSKKL